MILTGNELTVASSAVAALAIVGGYLGVRSANRNAVKIAREERLSRRQDELDALKRAAYTRCVAAILEVVTASIGASARNAGEGEIRRRIDAATAAHDAVVQMELTAPDRLRDLAFEALAAAHDRAKGGDTVALIKLRYAMRYDLRGADIPSPEELERMADIAMSEPASELEGGQSGKTLPGGLQAELGPPSASTDDDSRNDKNLNPPPSS